MITYLTSYPFTIPSFMDGMARTLDIGGTFDLYDEDEFDSPEEADGAALYSDWTMIGQDIEKALQPFC